MNESLSQILRFFCIKSQDNTLQILCYVFLIAWLIFLKYKLIRIILLMLRHSKQILAKLSILFKQSPASNVILFYLSSHLNGFIQNFHYKLSIIMSLNFVFGDSNIMSKNEIILVIVHSINSS